MDPDEALKNLKSLLASIDEAGFNTDILHDLLTEIREQFEALDGWLSKGGFWPEAWAWDR